MKQVIAEFTLQPTETADFLLEHLDKDHGQERDLEGFITQSLFETVNYWKNWISQSTYKGRWPEATDQLITERIPYTDFKQALHDHTTDEIKLVIEWTQEI